MEQLFTFTARDGTGLAASLEPDGENLPGGSSAWRAHKAIVLRDIFASAVIIGFGNAASILQTVRRSGYFYRSVFDPFKG